MRSLALSALAVIAAYPQTGAASDGEPSRRQAVSIEATEREPRTLAIPMAWAETLAPIVVHNVRTGVEGAVRLYRDDGSLDDAALEELARICTADAEPHPIAPRLAQLVFKSAYFFRARTVLVISGYRPQKNPNGGSRHATGEAMDFKLEGIKSPVLASVLRGYPRVGVGIYTHPRTRYVHLDVRDESYHWIDGSPPGVTWREQPMPDWRHYARDAAYTPQSDLPFLVP